MGFSSIVMPENYIAMFEVPEKAQADAIIDSSLPKIKALAVKIKNKQPLEPETITLSDRLISRLSNPLFYKTCVSAKGFYTTAACIGCKKCEVICPLNNIHLSDNRPVWGKSCTHCMACICACPTQAIEYNKKSQGKPRFYNTGYVES
jgi:ferredoxin